MYFVTLTYYDKDKGQVYNVLETMSEMTFTLNESGIKKLMTAVEIANFKLIDGELLECEWSHIPNKYTEQKSAICIGKCDNSYMIIESDIWVARSCLVDQAEFIDKVSNNQILNCEIRHHFGRKSSICIHNECLDLNDMEFKNKVQEEYNKYISKEALLGINNSFTFNVVGHDVILIKYTGTSKDVILPSFITVIGNKAFCDNRINSIKLNNGLRLIGNYAFMNNKISCIELPETVEIVASLAVFTAGFRDLIKLKPRSENTLIW